MNTKNTKARLVTVQILYFFDANQITSEDENNSFNKILRDITHSNGISTKNINKKLVKELINKTHTHIEKIDNTITSYLQKHESVHKLNILLKSILRSGVCELHYCNTPYKVTIDEYIKLTKSFFSKAEINFVNAILDKIAKNIKNE